MRLVLPTLIWLATLAPSARGQSSSSSAAAANRSVIDEDPLPSARAAALGGALSTTADDFDAAFHNPAGIGGLGLGKRQLPLIRKLYFPEIAVAANPNSTKLYNEFQKQGGANDSAIGAGILDANAGKEQYGRASVMGGAVFGRTLVVPFSDMQMAATAKDDGSGLIDLHYRRMTGIGFGFSAQDSEGRLSLGYFGYTATRQEIQGDVAYTDVADKSKRAEALKGDEATYSGAGHNVGLIYRLGKRLAPTLAVAVTNLGDTHFHTTGGAADLVDKQDMTVGFSVSPQLGKVGICHFTLEAGRLNEENVSLLKKYRLGSEILLGGDGSYATFALRGGYNYTGPSAGFALNLGLISLAATTYSVDIGTGNDTVTERREMATFTVNVASF